MKSIVALSCLIVSVLSVARDVDPKEFASLVDGSKNVFVMFYAPWCGHCKKFKPEYDEIAQSFKDEDSVEVVKVDADEHKDLAKKYGVTGFPTLKFFPKGSTDPEDFDGQRSSSGVVKFINEKTGLDVKVYEAPSFVTTLTTENWAKIGLDTTKHRLVEFYAPWCGHCKKLQPIYEELAQAFEQEESIVIAKVDATEEESLAQEFEVRGYPTLKWFPKGSEKPQPYNGGRQLNNFVDFINEQAGTRRNADGSLKKSAGRFAELDEIANEFFKNPSKRDSLKQKLEDAVGDFQPEDKTRYVKAMDKIAAKGDDYVSKEINRLQGLMFSESVKPDKRKNFMLRKNVLQGFLDGAEQFGAAAGSADKSEL